ncbi:MAG: Appr-1-p processing protein [Dehalococcoidia bacterium]|jgi:O-acetyl-ADP-ribose deacetylase (regulator of RNase III)
MKVNYIKGDATNPQRNGNKKAIIVHICNDKRRWGAGFVLALSKKWDGPEETYRNMPDEMMSLGNVMIIPVENDILVANMIAQHDIKPGEHGEPPIRYGALKTCLEKVNDLAKAINADIHMPRIGCGLAGGKWETVVKMIRQAVTVDVTVYDLFDNMERP